MFSLIFGFSSNVERHSASEIKYRKDIITYQEYGCMVYNSPISNNTKIDNNTLYLLQYRKSYGTRKRKQNDREKRYKTNETGYL